MNLLPLEVLPGWPQPEPVSDMLLMFLMVLGPLGFGVIVALLYFGPKLARERRERELKASSTELENTRPN
ncbi:hypothetical protein H5392_11105 [Tessaracoccus sp. MC1865]|uniref:Uncharacterized protein n=1 Tax=Tessaracoccus lubricantis TaxID=545543 RepID=A0ABP9FMV7_9ACTN|nr:MULTISPECIES: hypothetical protein [unclassified Tessaracoccus]MBB1484404.1 hypothetical protein [Tessaracoccus sp. MC1865]MBB1509270.1 hypothetical protein [Tessaracoccus sp. MC1756]MCG6567159.1 hypothetical protein [Tessaracoccus sp. ZS01]OMG57561.1 hypothetical protein BJN44_05905 [Tessaracoccus sp. ZS01]QTO38489.1 hypothetical protein J7D54_05210 [Tessaracoccus sp. MC1865]